MPDVIAAEAPSGSWLEAALVAGFVPYPDTLPLLLKACHMDLLDQLSEFQEGGVWGNVIGWAESFAEAYREYAQLLETFASELDNIAIAVNSDSED